MNKAIIAIPALLSVTYLLQPKAAQTTNDYVAPKTTRKNWDRKVTTIIKMVVDKSDYEMNVYDAEGWLATYPIVFGNKDQGDKMIRGDRKTPEGTFKVNIMKTPHKWTRYVGIDYPTKESWAKFKQRKKDGTLPKTANDPGGNIGIHGTWPGSEYVVDNYQNWTLGCISMKNEDIEDLYNHVTIGSIVEIKK
jgi:murein L,D-transpeptidase YafK